MQDKLSQEYICIYIES